MTLEESGLEEANLGGDAVEVETEKPVGLSARDAREVAVKAHRPEVTTDAPKPKLVDTAAREKDRGAGDGARDDGGTVRDEPRTLQPPAEFTGEEKADFLQATPKQQEAILRLHKSRQSSLSEIQRHREEVRREREEVQQVKALADSLTPYLKSTGVKEPTEVALKKAIAMWQEFETADPKQAAAAYLTARGIEVPKELLDGSPAPKPNDDKINSVHSELESLKSWKAELEQKERFQQNLQNWSGFNSIKNAAGGAKYPDIVGDSETVIQNATRIGQLVGNYGETEVSKAFLTLVRSKNPNASQLDILDAAYRYLDLKVDDSTKAPSHEDPQKHIARSNRAAMSVPGKGSPTLNGRAVKTFKDARDARAYAVRSLREREGH